MSDDFIPPAFGWVRDDTEVARICQSILDEGKPIAFADAAPALMSADATTPVFFWEAEEKVLQRILPSWNQGQVGSCVSFGYGRGAQDLLLAEIAWGEDEEWPGYEVATEPIYGGSRVEVGGGRLRGDGSVGAWAAKWVKDWGILLRKNYPNNDLTTYNEARCRQYGNSGCPNELEQEAKLHPITEIAKVTTADELWAALGAWKPVVVCSDRGFTTTLYEGFCEPSGSWSHCMEFRARFISPKRGKSIVIQNSWGTYLKGDRVIEVEGKGKIQLPEGCFATTLDVAARMCAQDDTFALAGMNGWKRRKIDWTP